MSTSVDFVPQTKMLVGFNIGANAVSGTLGPKGRNVFVDSPVSPKFTNDGATISRSIVLKDPQEEAGNKLIKNTCGQTLDDAGDGTTTSAVLIQAIVNECVKRPENPMEIRESLLETLPKIIKEIRSQSTSITKEDIHKVAMISAEDESLATNISEIFNKIGENAVITVEDSHEQGISYDLVNGYEANTGFMDQRFADPKDKKARCILEDVHVLVSEKKISAIGDIQPLWSKFAEQGITSCVIVCDDIETSMLNVFLLSKMSGKFNAVVIKASGDALKDIEAAVGATRVTTGGGVTFQSIDMKDLGKCKRVVIDANKSLFIPEDSSKSEMYANHLKKFAKAETNMYVKERLERRISQLEGGIAVLKIGSSDFEREYLKDKADDAIKACKAALEEGVVVGGGQCLARIATNMKAKTVGEQILKKALLAPFAKILENANKDYAEVLMKGGLNGYDVKNDKYVDMIESGIIDPAKVERCALENAVQNAAQFITMFASITEQQNDPGTR